MSGSRNVNQLPVITTVNSADKLYVAQSPFGSTNDRAVTYANAIAPALLKANNLSDVANTPASNSNLFHGAQNIISSNTTLDSTSWGSLFMVNTTVTSIQITLPPEPIPGPTNKYIDIYWPMTFTSPPAPFFSVVQITSPDLLFLGLGLLNLGIGPGDYVRLMQFSTPDYSGWGVIQSFLQPQNFLMSMSGTPTLVPLLRALAPYDTVVRDTTNGGFDTVGKRFFPLSPGLYELYHYTGFTGGNSNGNTQSNFRIIQNFGVTQFLTSENASLFDDVNVVPGVANKTEYYVPYTGIGSTSFAVDVLQFSSNTLNYATDQCFFGGRRVSLW